MWKCGYRYLSCEKLHKICQLVPTLQIREQLVNIWVFSAVSCSFLNASIHFLWTSNYAMTEYRVFLLTANFSICVRASAIFNFWMLYSVSKTSTYLKYLLMNDTRAVLRCFPDIWPYLSPRSLVNQTAGRWFKDRGSLVGEGACMVR